MLRASRVAVWVTELDWTSETRLTRITGGFGRSGPSYRQEYDEAGTYPSSFRRSGQTRAYRV